MGALSANDRGDCAKSGCRPRLTASDSPVIGRLACGAFASLEQASLNIADACEGLGGQFGRRGLFALI